MLIISQNLAKYGMPFLEDAIYRINLAWISSLDELISTLEKHASHPIFLDLPVKRMKPPHNKYSIQDLMPIIKSNENIKYFAISNVESSTDILMYVELMPKNVIIVPKIESANGIANINNIASVLEGPEKIVMLDHDDLYSSLAKTNDGPSKFKEYVTRLVEFCNTNNIKLLRIRGVIFSDTV